MHYFSEKLGDGKKLQNKRYQSILDLGLQNLEQN
jgi:hypothetical protein